MIDRQILNWASQLITESDIQFNESIKLDVNEENLPKVQKFLNDNSQTIREGMQFIDKNFLGHDLNESLEKINYKLKVCPGSQFNKYKTDPTETSHKNKEIRITEQYLKENPYFTKFNDKFGWSYHELVHALIFSGKIPKTYMGIKSPFGYPLSTDEIYTFGFQIRHTVNTSAYNNLMKYEAGRIEAWQTAFEMLRDIVC